jgi:hypothetical protein
MQLAWLVMTQKITPGSSKMQHAPIGGGGQGLVPAVQVEPTPRSISPGPQLMVELVTTQLPSERQHAWKHGPGLVQVVPGPCHTPKEAGQLAWVVIAHPPWKVQHAPSSGGQVLGLQVPPRVHWPGGGHWDATVMKHEPSGRQHLPLHGLGEQVTDVAKNVPPAVEHLSRLVMTH